MDDGTQPSTSSSSNEAASKTTKKDGNLRKIIIKPRVTNEKFTIPKHMAVSEAFRTFEKRILPNTKLIANNSTKSNDNVQNDNISVENQQSTSLNQSSIISVNQSAGKASERTIVPQIISGKITRMPIMVPKLIGAGIVNNQISGMSRAQKLEPKKLGFDYGLNIPIEAKNCDPKLAITSEPLLMHYQEMIRDYKKQIRELQNDIKNYRRREDRLKKMNKGPSISPICKKSCYNESSAKKKREIVQKLKESIDVLLGGCSVDEKKTILIKSFPEEFSEPKLSTEQTWIFERQFQLNSGIMEKYRKFLSQHNVNPFATLRQINTYKEKLQRENSALLHLQPSNSSSPRNYDNEAVNVSNNDDYIPNAVTVSRPSNSRQNPSVVTTAIRGELYTADASSIAAQYSQQLIQQEQYLRRFQAAQNYNTVTLNRQQQIQSVFIPTTTTSGSSTTYSSLYTGHY